jgi:hypothetical protein
MQRTIAVLVAICVVLGACGTNGGPTPNASQPTAPPMATQDADSPADLPTPAQEATMGASQTKPENPTPTDPTQLASEARPEPAAQPSQVAQPAFGATPIAPEPAATPAGRGAGTAPLDPAMARLVAGAQADLARRRGIPVDAIEVAEVRSVTWPDPSLGCPQPGMAYKQVPVDGVLIRLRADGMIFNYHGGGGRAPFLCEQPASGGSPAPAPGLGT